VTQPRTVVLDNEAVQALADVRHRKHRRALAELEAVAALNFWREDTTRVVAPTAVRVEAGWDRTDPRAARVNRLHIDDAPLDGAAANLAAQLRTTLDVSVADAHLGAVLATTPGPHAVLTSDAEDVRRMADHLGMPVNVVRV
jgi:hypothetical protein